MAGAPPALTIYNRDEQEVAADVTLELNRLGAGQIAGVEELFTGDQIAPREPIEIAVPARDLRVLALELRE